MTRRTRGEGTQNLAEQRAKLLHRRLEARKKAYTGRESEGRGAEFEVLLRLATAKLSDRPAILAQHAREGSQLVENGLVERGGRIPVPVSTWLRTNASNLLAATRSTRREVLEATARAAQYR